MSKVESRPTVVVSVLLVHPVLLLCQSTYTDVSGNNSVSWYSVVSGPFAKSRSTAVSGSMMYLLLLVHLVRLLYLVLLQYLTYCRIWISYYL